MSMHIKAEYMLRDYKEPAIARIARASITSKVQYNLEIYRIIFRFMTKQSSKRWNERERMRERVPDKIHKAFVSR